MKDQDKSKERLINELSRMRRRIDELEELEKAQRKLQEALRSSEERCRKLFESANDAILIADAETGEIVDANKEAERLLGRSKEEIIGMHQSRLHPEEKRQYYKERFRKAASSGQRPPYEAELLRKDGTIVPVSVSANLADCHGKRIIQSIFRDVSERKKMDAKLRESERRYRSTLDNMLEGCQIIGYDWRYLYVNDALARHGRRSREELLGHTMMEAYPGIEKTEFFSVLRRCMKKRIPHRMKNEFTFPDGSRGWFEFSIQPVPEGIFILSIDISERKRAEQALRERGELFRLLVRNVFDGINICEFDPATGKRRLIFCNDRYVEISGFTRDQLFNAENLNEFVIDHASEEELAHHYDCIVKEVPFTGISSWKRPDGRENIYEWTAVSVKKGDRFHIVGVDRDISERKKTVEALKQSEERFRKLSDASFEGIVIHERGKLVSANEQFYRMFGYRPDELAGRDLMALLISPESRDVVKHQVRTDGISPYEATGLKKDGTTFPMEVRVRLTEYEGRHVRVVAIRDLSEQKAAERALRESEAKFRSIFENVSDIVSYLDVRGRILDVNSRVEAVLGYKREEIIGKHFASLGLIRPKNLPTISRLFAYSIRRGKAERRMELELKHKNGRKVVVEVGTSFIRKDGKIEGVVNIFRDITERKRAEEIIGRAYRTLKKTQRELIRAEKLASLGEFASGLAHDIRNPLGNISTAARLCLKKREVDEEMGEFLEIILKNSRKATRIVEDLLDFARPKDLSLEPVSVSEVINKACGDMKDRCLEQGVRLQRRCSRGLGRIMLDAKLMEQVFLNFILNSLDAMKKGGRLFISAYPRGEEVIICFSDTGRGIRKKDLQRIFDPFFTTKKDGVGLGLSLARRIIEFHNGRIEVTSKVNQGTKVTVSLPNWSGDRTKGET